MSIKEGFFLLLAIIPYFCSAFAPASFIVNRHYGLSIDLLGPSAVTQMATTTTLNMAAGGKKKRRRRRKEPLPSKNDAPKEDITPTSEVAKEDEVDIAPPADAAADDDEVLPDFDFDEDAPPGGSKSDLTMESSSGSVASSSSSSSAGMGMEPGVDSSSGMDSPRWMEAMRGGAEEMVDVSPSDLLRSRDRSLEKSLSRFQTEDKEVLPTLDDARLKRKGLAVPDREDGGSKLGKKRARAEARRAAAVAAEEEETGGENPLKQVSFFLGEDGEVSPLKVLESGAWAGIIILVLWEIYINSPFFDRAGPMAPVVFQFIL